MASPDLQAKANALNARLEGEAKVAVDDIERNLLRPVARGAYACVVKCYDNAGKNGSSEALEQCSRQCQTPYQMANNVVQQVGTCLVNKQKDKPQKCLWCYLNLDFKNDEIY